MITDDAQRSRQIFLPSGMREAPDLCTKGFSSVTVPTHHSVYPIRIYQFYANADYDKLLLRALAV